jgi:S1-C subfamily serine protease
VRLAEQTVPQPEPTVATVNPRPGNRLIGVQVQEIDRELAQQLGLDSLGDAKGVLVVEVMRFGPAFNAGLSRGWVIQAVNGRPVTDVQSFDAALADIEPGDLLTITAVSATPDGELTHRIFNMTVPEE